MPETVTIIANYNPLEEPTNAPNVYRFADAAIYEINIDNNGDARPEIVYRFQFRTDVRDLTTGLYNTGPVLALNSPNLNERQFYTVTRIEHGHETSLGEFQVAPANIGPKSTPDDAALAGSAIFALPNHNGRVFADKAVIIGIWATASRGSIATSADGKRRITGAKQGSRVGMPLVNEVIISRKYKDAFNALEPSGDAPLFKSAEDFRNLVLDPELPKLMNKLYGIDVPPAPRNDLMQAFLTGLPNKNMPPNVTPAEMLRLNLGVPVTPAAQVSRLGALANDLGGFPNGRRLADDVVDIELRVAAGVDFLPSFPYLALPRSAFEQPE